VDNIRFGLATVTAAGLRFNSRSYSNAAMITERWFEQAQKHGEWDVPIVFDQNNSSYIAFIDLISFEVASSIELDNENIDELLKYFSAIQELKEILMGYPRRK
jgi:hypothetical protein